MSNDTRTLVERKLSGTYTTVSIDIPWRWFQNSVDDLKDYLTNHNLHYTTQQLLEDPRVVEAYDDGVADAQSEANLEYMDGWCFDSYSLFHDEIQEQVEIQRQAALKAEQDKQAKEEAEQAKLKAGSVQIDVPFKKHEKAIIILRAAGIIK